MSEVKKAYNLVASIYDTKFHNSVSKAEDQIVYSWLKQFQHNSVTLDLGCGTGSVLENTSLEPLQYLGVDFSENMIRQAQHKFPSYTFQIEDIKKLPFPDESFDNVISMYCALSYAGPEGIKEALRVLKTHGRYFFMFYTEQYHTRKTYILNQEKHPVPFYAFKEVSNALPVNNEIRGLNYTGDSYHWLPTALTKRLMQHKKKGKEPYFIVTLGEKQ